MKKTMDLHLGILWLKYLRLFYAICYASLSKGYTISKWSLSNWSKILPFLWLLKAFKIIRLESKFYFHTLFTYRREIWAEVLGKIKVLYIFTSLMCEIPFIKERIRETLKLLVM